MMGGDGGQGDGEGSKGDNEGAIWRVRDPRFIRPYAVLLSSDEK